MKDWKLYITFSTLGGEYNIKMPNFFWRYFFYYSYKKTIIWWWWMHIKHEKATIIHLLQCIAVNYGIISAATEERSGEEKEGWGGDEGREWKIKKTV